MLSFKSRMATNLSEEIRKNKVVSLKQAEETAKKEKTLSNKTKIAEQQKIQQEVQEQKQQPTKESIITEKRNAVNEKYDSKISALGSPPSKYYQKPKYTTNRWTGKTRLIGYTREPNNREIQRYTQKVATITRERNTAQQIISLRHANIAPAAKAKALRHLNKHPNTKNLVTLATNYQNNQEIKSDFDRQSSITTAKSQAVQARTKNQKVINEFKSKKEKIDPTRAGTAAAALGTNKVTVGTKTRPGIKQSSYFAKEYKTPVSIIGSTIAASNEAIKTFKETEFQQQKLFKAVTGSKDFKQAIQFQESYRKENPYVGTANTLLYKGEIIDSSGVLIEKKLRSEKFVSYDPIAKPETKLKEIKPESIQSYDVPNPLIETSTYIPGSFDYIFSGEKQYQKERLAEEIRIAGGTYGDYLKTIDMNSLDSQIKLIGKGAKRGFNSYTSLVGVKLLSDTPQNKSLIDLAFTDIYNSVYPVVIKPNKSMLESLGVNVIPAPKNPKPFELTSKAFNERTLAENVGDIIVVGTTELGIGLLTGGLGNLAIRGASKLPYFLKTIPKTPKQIIETAAETKTKTVHVPGMGKVKLTNFDYIEPGKRSTKTKKINPAPGIPLKTIKIGRQKITVFDFEAIPKIPKQTTKKKPRTITNTKLGKLLAKHTPQYKNLIIDITKETTKKKPQSAHSKLVNNRFVRKIGQSKILNPKKKDKGKDLKGEPGTEYNFSNNYKFPALPKPGQTTKTATTPKQGSQKLVESTKTTPPKPNPKKKYSNDISVVETYLHENRPRVKTSSKLLNSLIDQEVVTGQAGKVVQDSSTKLVEMTEDILKNATSQKLNSSLKFDEVSKKNQKLQNSISLLVSGGKGKLKDRTSTSLIRASKTSTKQTSVVVTRTQRSTTRKALPGLNIPGFKNKLQKKNNSRKGRKDAPKYSIWNVDVENIGALPGEELVVSKSSKVFKKLDKRQTKANQKRAKKTTKKSTKKPTKKRKSKRK